jgi:hypothetical protein
VKRVVQQMKSRPPSATALPSMGQGSSSVVASNPAAVGTTTPATDCSVVVVASLGRLDVSWIKVGSRWEAVA